MKTADRRELLEDGFFTVKQAAEFAHVSRWTIQDWEKEGLVTVRPCARKVLIPKKALIAFLADRMAA